MYLYFRLFFCSIDRRAPVTICFFIAISHSLGCHGIIVKPPTFVFRLTLTSGMRSFSALEHRFLQDLHLYRAAAFHKKIATQRKVVWRKDVYNRKNPQQFFNNIYIMNRHPLSNDRERETCFLRIFYRLSFCFLKRLRFQVLKAVSIVFHCAIKKRWQRHITYVWFQYIYDWLHYIRFGARTKFTRPSFMIIRINDHA